MSKKKKFNPLLTAVAGLAVAGVYNYVKGNGIFNKSRFKNEHDALARYVDAHYKNAFYSPIAQTDNGWVSVITTLEGKQISVTISKFDNTYVFKETEL